jgi:GTP-binding protein HflX
LLWLLFVQFDKAEDPEALKLEAANRRDVVCISALTGEGIKEFYEAVENKLKVNTV